MHLIDRKSIPTRFEKSYYNDKWLKPFYFVEILYIGSGLNPSLCVLNVVGLSISMDYHFQNFIHAQNPSRPDESGKLHEAQSTAIKLNQRPTEARFG